MRPCRGDGFFSTPESARLLGVRPSTIRKWRQRGWLQPQGLDERGNPLHTREALWAADALVRANGLRTSGTDPRQLRQRSAA
jgi:DNA-binding transcriptional MerR regulator